MPSVHNAVDEIISKQIMFVSLSSALALSLIIEVYKLEFKIKIVLASRKLLISYNKTLIYKVSLTRTALLSARAKVLCVGFFFLLDILFTFYKYRFSSLLFFNDLLFTDV